MKFLFGAIVLAMLVAVPIASSADTTIGIDNHYGAVLDGFYLQALSTGHSPSDWSANMLNDGALGSVINPFTSDDKAIVNLSQDTCAYNYNVRAHWSDGSTNYWSDIDFCLGYPDADFTNESSYFWAVPQ